MARREIHIDDVGTVFTFIIKDSDGEVLDLSGGSDAVTIRFRQPESDTVITKTGTIIGGGTTGQVQYTTVASDLPVAGIWKVQAFVTTTSWVGYSDVHSFRVYGNL